MGTIQQKLAYLEETKRLIAAALKTKGVEPPPGTPFRDYYKLIELISGDSSGGEVPLPPSSSPGGMNLQISVGVQHKVKVPHKYRVPIDIAMTPNLNVSIAELTYRFKDPYKFNCPITLNKFTINNLTVIGGM